MKLSSDSRGLAPRNLIVVCKPVHGKYLASLHWTCNSARVVTIWKKTERTNNEMACKVDTMCIMHGLKTSGTRDPTEESLTQNEISQINSKGQIYWVLQPLSSVSRGRMGSKQWPREKKTYIANIADIERYRDCRAKTRAGIEESMSHEASKALNDSRRCVIKWFCLISFAWKLERSCQRQPLWYISRYQAPLSQAILSRAILHK